MSFTISADTRIALARDSLTGLSYTGAGTPGGVPADWLAAREPLPDRLD
ncbi:hypothetical protein ACQSSU_11535 [Micromonospora echinospora]